jgi:hypothetical protein
MKVWVHNDKFYIRSRAFPFFAWVGADAVEAQYSADTRSTAATGIGARRNRYWVSTRNELVSLAHCSGGLNSRTSIFDWKWVLHPGGRCVAWPSLSRSLREAPECDPYNLGMCFQEGVPPRDELI